MTTQVVFNIDPKIKAKAMKRAKREGVPFSSFLKMATEKFAEGEYSIGIIPREVPNAKTARGIRAALRDIQEGNEKNFSPAFTDIRKMRRWMGGGTVRRK